MGRGRESREPIPGHAQLVIAPLTRQEYACACAAYAELSAALEQFKDAPDQAGLAEMADLATALMIAVDDYRNDAGRTLWHVRLRWRRLRRRRDATPLKRALEVLDEG
jgi:hypothetical protein